MSVEGMERGAGFIFLITIRRGKGSQQNVCRFKTKFKPRNADHPRDLQILLFDFAGSNQSA